MTHQSLEPYTAGPSRSRFPRIVFKDEKECLREEPVDTSNNRIAMMLRGVQTCFSSGEAYEIARQEGITVSERTLRRDPRKAEKKGLIWSLSDNGA